VGFNFEFLYPKPHGELEQQLRTWASDWIEAANRRDEGSRREPEAAIEGSGHASASGMSMAWGDSYLRHRQNVSIIASALQILVLREYCLYLRLRPAALDTNTWKCPVHLSVD